MNKNKEKETNRVSGKDIAKKPKEKNSAQPKEAQAESTDEAEDFPRIFKRSLGCGG